MNAPAAPPAPTPAPAPGYIQVQIGRLGGELQKVAEQVNAEALAIQGDNDKALAFVGSDIGKRASELCDAAIQRSLKEARRQAWPAAFSLAAPWGPGRPQAFIWLGLLFGTLVLGAWATPSSAIGMLVVFVVAY